MKLGVKAGSNNWKNVLSQVNPDCFEVWFQLEKSKDYQELFQYLANHIIPFGIHFWAVVQGKYEPNLLYEHDGIAENTEEKIRETILLAEKVGAVYVNIHPGSYYLKLLDFENKKMTILSDKYIEEPNSVHKLIVRGKALNTFALQHNIKLLWETLPKNEVQKWYGQNRRIIQKGKNLSSNDLLQLAHEGFLVTNDFGHIIAEWEDKTPEDLWNLLYDRTSKLAPYTKVIHLNTVIPPFNGTDSHNGILEQDFVNGAIPNYSQLLQLFSLFQKRDDVWIIPEPKAEDMVENYTALVNSIKILNKQHSL